jgi:hypothetical protein
VQANDDVLTVCAVNLLAEILANVLHEIEESRVVATVVSQSIKPPCEQPA